MSTPGGPPLAVRIVTDDRAVPWVPARPVRIVSGGGGGGGGGGSVAPAAGFDRTLYRGTVEFNPTGNATVAGFITLDENVTWYAQWGKMAELKFRATVDEPDGTTQIPSDVPLVRLHGLGLFADDYHEILTVYVGGIAGSSDMEGGGGAAFPAVIRQVNPDDWTAGYDLMLQQGFQLSAPGRPVYLRAATVLTSAMYFHNGTCILDDPQYVTVGGFT